MADISDLPHNISTSGYASMSQAKRYHKTLYQCETKKKNLAQLLKVADDSLEELTNRSRIQKTRVAVAQLRRAFDK